MKHTAGGGARPGERRARRARRARGRFNDAASVHHLVTFRGGIDVERLKADNVALASEVSLLRRENAGLKRQLEELRPAAEEAAPR